MFGHKKRGGSRGGAAPSAGGWGGQSPPRLITVETYSAARSMIRQIEISNKFGREDPCEEALPVRKKDTEATTVTL